MAMGDYGWSMDFDTSQDIVAVEYGRRVLAACWNTPEREIKYRTMRKPDLFR